MMAKDLYAFITESNRIEAIRREPTPKEIEAHLQFLSLDEITLADLQTFVSAIAPHNHLRTAIGDDVRVGNYYPPPGGPQIALRLQTILDDIEDSDPYTVHQQYEHLHPFTDGNGRSGRALWLWMMGTAGQFNTALDKGFLHLWYYQSLDAGRS